jgi:hypothetical protein
VCVCVFFFLFLFLFLFFVPSSFFDSLALFLTTTTNYDDRHRYERLAKMLISIKAGIKHLQDKLDPVREDLDGGRRLELTDETVVTVLVETEKSMLRLLNRMKASEAEEMAYSGIQEEDDAKLIALSKTMTIDNVDDAVLLSRPNNQRVELPNMEDEWEADGPIKSDDVIPDVDEEELTRDKVKKASNQLMNQQEKKKKKPKRRAD